MTQRAPCGDPAGVDFIDTTLDGLGWPRRYGVAHRSRYRLSEVALLDACAFAICPFSFGLRIDSGISQTPENANLNARTFVTAGLVPNIGEALTASSPFHNVILDYTFRGIKWHRGK